MADYDLPYGNGSLRLTLPDDLPVQLITPAETAAASDPGSLITAALDHPIGGVQLADFAGADSAAVAISDKTRPIPHAALRLLLDRLESLGLHVTLLVATGTHAPLQPGEFPMILPDDILSRWPVISHDCDDSGTLVYLGETRRGTPVWANRCFVEADLRIVVGNIEPHQFMGFSGGVKSAAVGLAGRATVCHNHAMMTAAGAVLGRYEKNPVRQDVEEIGRLMGVQFALNTILAPDKQIVHVLAGDPLAVMQAGIPLVCDLYEIHIPAPLDLAITSPGGHPKDINLYQAQKALAHAARVTRDGGTVILVAACPEGTGNASYEQWVRGMPSHETVLERFAREEFRLGPHKAFQIARDAVRVRVLFVSTLPPDRVRGLLLTPAASLDDVVRLALADLGPGARVGLLPAANTTMPLVMTASSSES